jgi:hypothetical protein
MHGGAVLGAKFLAHGSASSGPTRGRKGPMFELALNCALVCRWVDYGVHFVSQADNP